MKLFFKITLFGLFLFLLIFSIYSLININNVNFEPTSSQNNFILKLQHAFKVAQITPIKEELISSQNQYQFYLIENEQATKIILSTQKNPYWQISSLQQILKTAKIKQIQLQLIDLSVNHPYATTLKNS